MTGEFARSAIPALWTCWLIVWLVAARFVKPTRWQEPAASRLSYGVPILLGAVLLAWRGAVPALQARLVAPSAAPSNAGTALVAVGVALMLWARWHLGRNWSSVTAVKEDHSLVRTGPYRAIRHPIYTGLILALAGTALAIGEWRGLVALVVMGGGFVRKLRLEERRMVATFPEYAAYRRQSWALIPPLY